MCNIKEYYMYLRDYDTRKSILKKCTILNCLFTFNIIKNKKIYANIYIYLYQITKNFIPK
jgi:hypothetical protein